VQQSRPIKTLTCALSAGLRSQSAAAAAQQRFITAAAATLHSIDLITTHIASALLTASATSQRLSQQRLTQSTRLNVL